jgi:hypothetical protein
MSEIHVTRKPMPSPAQRAWLARGLDQPGGKLPLFDREGQRIDPRTIQACVEQGWAEPWFHNPLKPDWLVCKLTEAGRAAIARPRVVRLPVAPARTPAAAKPPA